MRFAAESPVRAEAIPVTIVGGYLGAGKTTLINRLLTGGHGLRLFVLVNDFGEVNIDARLVARHDGQTIALSNGCVCCSIAGDLGVALKQVADERPAPDHIVVEASGVADPARTANYTYGWRAFRPNGVVVLVDATTVRTRVDDKFVGSTLRRQIAGGDMLIISKTDLLPPAMVEATADWLSGVAPTAMLHRAVRGELPWQLLLGMRTGSSVAARTESEAHGVHTELGEFSTLTWRCPAPVDRRRFGELLGELGPSLLRCKGWLRFQDSPERQIVVQSVGGVLEPGASLSGDVGSEDLLVFILRRGAIAADDLRRRLDAIAK